MPASRSSKASAAKGNRCRWGCAAPRAGRCRGRGARRRARNLLALRERRDDEERDDGTAVRTRADLICERTDLQCYPDTEGNHHQSGRDRGDVGEKPHLVERLTPGEALVSKRCERRNAHANGEGEEQSDLGEQVREHVRLGGGDSSCFPGCSIPGRRSFGAHAIPLSGRIVLVGFLRSHSGARSAPGHVRRRYQETDSEVSSISATSSPGANVDAELSFASTQPSRREPEMRRVHNE